MKSLLVFMMIYFGSREIRAQNWHPEFSLPLGSELLSNINIQNLSSYLERNLPWHRPGSCEVEFSVFHFRVNSEGKIDSIRTEGNLSKEVSAQIIKNIYKTEGKWKIPDHSKPGDKCWFVYPYFLFGNYRPCQNTNKTSYQQMYILYHIYSETADTRDSMGRVILSPNRFAKLDEK
ncbi:hypothetical protein ACFP1I_09610 [Dyadobacter subterraneus]|uniref:TonB C-terminal domain-containing protein n=1 Tax=Dyadobacter subterraneus TaxID=2773304 RepID=A0ABR9WAZ2_9BACT|nr:hypothetical protein [Dyadobacter subterraneus]MBE9462642.1 hypothetical protein [Dyadobacter subterraneus]